MDVELDTFDSTIMYSASSYIIEVIAEWWSDSLFQRQCKDFSEVPLGKQTILKNTFHPYPVESVIPILVSISIHCFFFFFVYFIRSFIFWFSLFCLSFLVPIPLLFNFSFHITVFLVYYAYELFSTIIVPFVYTRVFTSYIFRYYYLLSIII